MPRRGESGFTLIELLVVMLIIALLAAIAVPLFIHQRTKAYDTHAKTAIHVATTAIEVYRQDHNTYAGVDAPALIAIEPALGAASGFVVSGDPDGFAISVDS